MRTPAARHFSTTARCQGSANHSTTASAMTGPTPSTAASSSGAASRIALDAPQLSGERLRRRRTDVADRQRDEHPPQRAGLGLLEVVEELGRVGGQPAVLAGEERARHERLGGQVEQVALVRDQPAVEQRDRGLVAEHLDVEGTAPGDVEQPLAQLSRAGPLVGAADVDVALAGRSRAACRTQGIGSA